MNKTFGSMPGTKNVGNYIIGTHSLKKARIWAREPSAKSNWASMHTPKKKSPSKS